LANPEEIEKSKIKLSEILEYNLNKEEENQQKYIIEDKTPNQVFLGLQPGQLISLEDKKVFEPTNEVLINYYKGIDGPLSDTVR